MPWAVIQRIIIDGPGYQSAEEEKKKKGKEIDLFGDDQQTQEASDMAAYVNSLDNRQ